MATNFWSKRASFLLSGINFKDGVSIDSLSADPTVTATDAKTSSIGIFNGVAYIKTDDGLTTNWESLGLESDLLAHINQATDAHDASAISVDNTNTTILKESLITDTQTALETLDAELLEALSTGLYKFTNGGLTVNVDPTKFDIGEVDGHIVDSVGATKAYKDIAVPAVTGITPIITDGTVFVYYDATSTLVQSTTPPTAQDRRDKIYLGRVTVLSGNVIGTAPEPTIVSDPTNQTRDFAEALRTFNVSGNLITPSAANNLQIRKTSGSIFSMGRNFASDIYNPNVISFPAADPVGFIYGGQTLASIVYTTVTSLDPTQYDNGGTIQAITGSNNRATLQRVYLFTDGRLAIQYGQVVYNSLALALQASSNEDFVENPIVFANKGVLLATIAIAKGCTSTQDETTCKVLLASRFGQGSVGAAGVSVSSLQNAYDNKIDAIPDIVIDPTRVDPELSIVNDSDDAVRDLFGVYNNAKDTEFLAVDPTETRVKQLGFTDNVTSKVNTTTGENITYTDSLGTELLRKESDLLFIEDFKENAPTTFLTASNAAITVNDATNSTYLSNTIATFTQSSALTTQYVESNPIPVTKKSWWLEPIKIQAMQGITGGAGTWDLRVFTSTDGIAYTDSNIIVQVGDLKNDKIITQLASDVTHIKLRWTVVNPDDATTLTLGGILITSQAFEVGQTIIEDSFTASDATSSSGIVQQMDNVITDVSNTILSRSTSGDLIITANKDCSVVINSSFLKTVNGSGHYAEILIDRGTGSFVRTAIQGRQAGATGAPDSYASATWSERIKKGWRINFYNYSEGGTIDNSYVSVTATAYADNVIVDGKISGVIGSYVVQAESTEIPQGTLLADGAAVSRTIYADLFAVIGTTYGVGDGSTTFNLPDKSAETVGTYFIRYASPSFVLSVPIVQANTNGVEYPTNESVDGKPVYARTWRQGADISGGATLNIATIETGLNPVNATNKVSKDEWWYIRIDSLGGANVFYRYNRVSGIVSVATQSGAESFENTLITLKYTKP